MPQRVNVNPEMLRWACERSGLGVQAFTKKLPRLDRWLEGDGQPTLKQLETLARVTHTPVGYLFLRKPPEELVPIPDFRTVGARGAERPSPDLLDTIYLCQQRQEWYRNHARMSGEEPRDFVGVSRVGDEVVEAAERIRERLGFSIEERGELPTWTAALRRFVEQAEEAGVLVMINGVVGTNNHRPLDVQEFRGFALADSFAPLVFINGKDTKSAQMFTLAHELAHLWAGESALSDVEPVSAPSHQVEIWCNQVAAELLVPLEAMKREHDPEGDLREEIDRLARHFKVSTLVIIRRMHDVGGLTRDEMWAAYRAELEWLKEKNVKKSNGGGDFHLTQAVRVSRRFARALVVSTFEGRSSFTEAFRLLGIKKTETLRQFGRRLGVEV